MSKITFLKVFGGQNGELGLILSLRLSSFATYSSRLSEEKLAVGSLYTCQTDQGFQKMAILRADWLAAENPDRLAGTRCRVLEDLEGQLYAGGEWDGTSR